MPFAKKWPSIVAITTLVIASIGTCEAWRGNRPKAKPSITDVQTSFGTGDVSGTLSQLGERGCRFRGSFIASNDGPKPCSVTKIRMLWSEHRTFSTWPPPPDQEGDLLRVESWLVTDVILPQLIVGYGKEIIFFSGYYRAEPDKPVPNAKATPETASIEITFDCRSKPFRKLLTKRDGEGALR